MSASLYWHIKPTKGRHVDGCGTRVRDILANVFGEYPITLNRDNLATLRAMMIVEKDCLAWEALYNAVNENNEIQVTERY